MSYRAMDGWVYSDALRSLGQADTRGPQAAFGGDSPLLLTA